VKKELYNNNNYDFSADDYNNDENIQINYKKLIDDALKRVISICFNKSTFRNMADQNIPEKSKTW